MKILLVGMWFFDGAFVLVILTLKHTFWPSRQKPLAPTSGFALSPVSPSTISLIYWLQNSLYLNFIVGFFQELCLEISYFIVKNQNEPSSFSVQFVRDVVSCKNWFPWKCINYFEKKFIKYGKKKCTLMWELEPVPTVYVDEISIFSLLRTPVVPRRSPRKRKLNSDEL